MVWCNWRMALFCSWIRSSTKSAPLQPHWHNAASENSFSRYVCAPFVLNSGGKLILRTGLPFHAPGEPVQILRLHLQRRAGGRVLLPAQQPAGAQEPNGPTLPGACADNSQRRRGAGHSAGLPRAVPAAARPDGRRIGAPDEPVGAGGPGPHGVLARPPPGPFQSSSPPPPPALPAT